ncbi:GDP-D-glucose phosphorylase 1 isoform X2 [Pseudomyrmex gracilis]|uniref:GDP-D-glucose phosphorylase 1 isoform X2 n=1 Tax=Pseudomyrmex gracilis TaxID=219809 RepID=UPI0009957ACA|nr:GDP-D-glucose phosphorylase 1 isoform X2 [Pseudomyrmex gracilis]
MISQNEIPTFRYNTENFHFIVKSNVENDSAFDSILQRAWKQAEKVGAFRYNLNIRSSKTLRGRYRFLAQFNPERGHCRRAPESITFMRQPFDPARFNFTKLSQKEILFDVGNGDLNDVVAINSSPLESGHCLLLSERLKCLPQVMTEYSLLKAVELCLLSSSWSLRIVFNSLCAFASVNHLHWHLYYLRYEMLLEYINICDYIKGVHLLVDYPAKGFCLKLSDFKDITDFVSRAICLVNYLQSREIPHNTCITRAKSKPGDELYDDMKIRTII